MSWLGKIFGGTFGFLMGGPLGAILGAALGHQFDKGMNGMEERIEYGDFNVGSQHRIQMAFFTATFSIMGHLAKADGKVTREEIELAKRIMSNMDLTPDMRAAAQMLFSEGKSADFPLAEALEQFRLECNRRSTLIRMFIEIQLQAAYADGTLDPTEERLLWQICDHLRLPRFEYIRLKAILEAQQRFSRQRYQHSYRHSQEPSAHPSINDAYGVLGSDPTASDAEIKRAYRRLISQHHPDKLVAKGLPEEMMKIATEKTQEIRRAYEMIQEARGKK